MSAASFCVCLHCHILLPVIQWKKNSSRPIALQIQMVIRTFCCEIRISPTATFRFLPVPVNVQFDVSCSSDGKQNGSKGSQKNWPLRHCALNKKTKLNSYLNVWGRRGFTLEPSCSNMRYLHSVQLPSHCGLGKQYGSPILPPPPKKPPPKLVFLWPVIKTWVWMRASVSPEKITHTHSQWGGSGVVYSTLPRHLMGAKWFISTDLAVMIGWWAQLTRACSTVHFPCVYSHVSIHALFLTHVWFQQR